METNHNRRMRADPVRRHAWTARITRGAPRWWPTFHAIAIAAVVGVVTSPGWAAEAGATIGAASDAVKMWGFVAAALSVGLTALGAAYAVSHVGAAALGTMGERPEISGRALIFLGLAEGIAIYGLIIAIMILGRLG